MRGRGRGEEERERKEREKKEIHVHVLVTVHSFFNESPPTEISLQIVNLPPNLAQYLMINTSRGGRFFFSDKWRKRKIPTLQLNSRILGRKRGRERGWDQKLKVARISGRGGGGGKGVDQSRKLPWELLMLFLPVGKKSKFLTWRHGSFTPGKKRRILFGKVKCVWFFFLSFLIISRLIWWKRRHKSNYPSH